MKKNLIRDILIYLSITIISIIAYSGIKNLDVIYYSFSSMRTFHLQFLTRLGLGLITEDISFFNKILGMAIIISTLVLPLIYVIKNIKKEKKFQTRYLALFFYIILLIIDMIIHKIGITEEKTIYFYYSQVVLFILFYLVIMLELINFAKQKGVGIAKCVTHVGRGYIIYYLFTSILEIAMQTKIILNSKDLFPQGFYFTTSMALLTTLLAIVLFESIVLFYENKEKFAIKNKIFHLNCIKVESLILMIFNFIIFLDVAIKIWNKKINFNISLINILTICIPLFICLMSVVYIQKYSILQAQDITTIIKEPNENGTLLQNKLENELEREESTITNE